jgi:pimeloyl-ACP methyl ester carboxylesterase
MSTVELAFEVFGEPNACPIIILHGFLASSRNWRSVAKTLAVHHCVYVLDMRNHGASPHAELMNYPVMARDILCFMNNKGFERAHLLGHSMGGKVAMWFALHYPDRVEQLMIVDIGPVAYQHSFQPTIHALKQLPLRDLANRKHAEQLLAEDIPDLAFRQFLLQNLQLNNGVYSWRINLDIIQTNAHYVVGFPDVQVDSFSDKALFLAGQNSVYIDAESVRLRFPYATIEVIPDTGHWLYVEAPDIFCDLIINWLDG